MWAEGALWMLTFFMLRTIAAIEKKALGQVPVFNE